MEYLWASLLMGGLAIAWAMNAAGLPGNWIMLAGTVVYWILTPPDHRTAIGPTVLIVMGALAVVGEIVELLAGSAGVTKAGGSRRGAVYAILGSIIGGFLGMGVGFPIPIIGPLIGALLFASLGAMAGAMYGEKDAGRDWSQTLSVGKAAFVGRALGTLAKMGLGLLMIVAALVGLLVA